MFKSRYLGVGPGHNGGGVPPRNVKRKILLKPSLIVTEIYSCGGRLNVYIGIYRSKPLEELIVSCKLCHNGWGGNV